MPELHLDMNRLLLGHAAASLVAGLSNSPIWNLPLSLYGLYVVGHEGSDGEAVRQFAALFAGSFIVDFFWLVSHETRGLVRLLLLLNFLLKPVTLLSSLGHLRERGHQTFPGNFSLPGNFGGSGMPGGFPPQQAPANEPVWSAPQVYHQQQRNFASVDEEAHRPPPHSKAPSQGPAAAPAYTGPTSGGGGEGGGYHTLE